MLIVLHEQLGCAQQKMKSYAETNIVVIYLFRLVTWFILKPRPYRLFSLARRVIEKLEPTFYGPFPVIQCIGQVAYKLQLPPTFSIHPVFHISQLRPAVGTVLPTVALPSQLSEDLELLLEPVEVLGYRMIGNSIPHDVEVLIRWKDLPAHETTWEPFTLIQNQFPSFQLEDKVTVRAGGFDMPPIKSPYSRKKSRGRHVSP